MGDVGVRFASFRTSAESFRWLARVETLLESARPLPLAPRTGYCDLTFTPLPFDRELGNFRKSVSIHRRPLVLLPCRTRSPRDRTNSDAE
jgi:hypothetical protein